MQTKTKQAVSQQLSVMTALIGKQTASYLVPNYNDGQKLAIVDEGVLKYLESLLPTAPTNEIIYGFIERLNNIVQSGGVGRLEKAVNEAKDFVAFHETVNLMKKYFDPTVKVEYEEPFNQPVREMTITEKAELWNELAQRLHELGNEIEEYNNNRKGGEPEIILKTEAEIITTVKQEGPTVVSPRRAE